MQQIIAVAALAVAVLFSLTPASAVAQDAGPSGVVIPPRTGGASQTYDDGSVLVRFGPNASPANRAAARGQINGSLLRAYKLVAGLEHVRLHGGMDVQQAIAILRRLPFVVYAQPNYIIYANQQAPNDQYLSEQWSLHNTGQGSGWGVWPPGRPDADIDYPEAWVNAAGGGSVVAVIDTGIDYRHSDLAANVWQNTAEANGLSGVDDDGNGYVDDIRGWDFANDDNNPLDGHGHGSHVAGTIAAVTNNNTGVAGVMWSGQVMALKVLDDSGFGFLSDAVEALQYAITMGVRVSNNSWGYSEIPPEELADHQALRDAIEAAGADADPDTPGHLFVAAAGNDSVDTDVTPHYPSSFALDNIIAVAATDNNDELAWFSSYGQASVDLGAPGDYVFATYKLFAGSIDDYAWLSGTSMATPHVAGVAGLLVGLQPGWTYQQVKDQILDNVRPLAVLSGITVTGGVLNMHDALDGVPAGGGGPGPGTPPPAMPENLTATDQADGSALIEWVDMADDELGFELERERWHKRRGYIDATVLPVSADVVSLVDATGSGDYRYRIRAYNDGGYSAWSTGWAEVSVTEASGGGKPDKPCRGRNCP